MSANSLVRKDANDSVEIKQEWSIFPPQPAPRSSIVTPVSDQRPAAFKPSTDSAVRQCRYCTETLPPGARECPLCLREIVDPPADRRATISQPPTLLERRPQTGTVEAGPLMAGPGSSNLALTENFEAEAAPTGAVYTLESPAQCPECDTEINSIHVIRVLRTQVSFTSTLPRKAYVIACPACKRLLSAGLSGLL